MNMTLKELRAERDRLAWCLQVAIQRQIDDFVAEGGIPPERIEVVMRQTIGTGPSVATVHVGFGL